jgi:serine/threonine protein kinase
LLGRNGGEHWAVVGPDGAPAAAWLLPRPLDREEASRLARGLEKIGQLRHPHLLGVRAWREMVEWVVVLTDLAGESLRDRLCACRQSCRPGIPAGELARYCLEAADALDYLHEHQWVHRDVKPDNLRLVDQHVKVGDEHFLVWRWLEPRIASTATYSGTPRYMAPEVWRCRLSPHSDQYSLAVSYAELRFGRPVVSANDMVSLMLAHLEGKPDLEPLPAAEQYVLRQALAKDPGQRFHSCRQFTQALAQAVGADSGGPPASAER